MHSISGSTTMVEAPADSSKQPDPRIINNSNTLSNISTTTPSGDTSSRTSGNATDTPRNARNSRLDPPAKISTSTEINSETSVQPPHAVDATEAKQVIESSSPSNSRPVSPTDQDSDENPENASDLQFKKKDFHKSRTQSFQSVLSSASLKSLRHQFTIPSQPQLKRNPSTISQSNTKNFQSFIQAPVLSSVTNLRTADDVEIGQRLPFDQKLNSGLDFNDKRSRRNSLLESAGGDAGGKGFEKDDDEEDSEDDEDNYKEETTLQQQRLTLNALKKLSLSLAPIIRSDDDEQGPQSRQLTTKSLNSSKQEGRVRDLRPVLRSTSSKKSKPYQPAEVDLSSFSSLTRQSKHNNDTGAPPQVAAGPQDGRVRTDSQIMQPSQAQVERAAHSQAQTQTQSHSQPQNHLQQSSTQTHTSSQSATVSQTRTQTQGLMEHNVSETSNTPAQMPTPRSGSSDMRNTGFEKNLNPNAHSQNKSLFVGNQLTRKAESQFPEVNSKMVSNSMTGAGKSSSNSSESQVSSSRNSSNLMRPTQLSTNFHQRDSTGRIQGPVPETSHGSSFGSSKSHGSDKRLQQINGFRSPMYIPAVLRKNVDEMLELGADADGHGEHHGENNEVGGEAGSSATSIKSVDSVYSLEPSASPGLHSRTGPYELTKRQYDYILRAAPTRKHWVKDETVIKCGINDCRRKFNFFERRHHCRKCGGIFCKEHTSHYLYINHLAQFTTGGRGTLSRVCDNCIQEYNEFMKHEFGVTCQKPSSRESLPQQSALNKIDYRKEIFTSKMSGSIPMKQSDSNEDNNTSDQLAGSVPANWSWSSF